MATATKRKPAAEETEGDAALNWKMPRPEVGSTVNWLSSGDRSNEPQVATVLRVSMRTMDIQIWRADGRPTRLLDVHHVDDPLLPENEQWLRTGAWSENAHEERVAKLEARVAMLEELIVK